MILLGNDFQATVLFTFQVFRNLVSFSGPINELYSLFSNTRVPVLQYLKKKKDKGQILINCKMYYFIRSRGQVRFLYKF